MKEKIKKIHDKYTAPCKFGITSSDLDLVSQEIESLVDLEVEKRIKESMPTRKVGRQYAATRFRQSFPYEKKLEIAAFMDGFEFIFSRLTNDSQRHTPQVPYKTEGGGE